tara:strand:- start:463 stop:651 length:189 start_codon:yes stop_codon:yes gene_type:complete
MRKLESFNMTTRYDILCKGEDLYKGLGQIEYFEVMEDLAMEYYQTGFPNPSELETKMYEVKE